MPHQYASLDRALHRHQFRRNEVSGHPLNAATQDLLPQRNRPHRIAHVTTVDMTVRFLLLNQLLYLRDFGYEVAALCTDGPWVADVRSRGITVHTVTMKRAITPLSDLITLFRLYRCFRRLRFDLVHTHTPKANLLGQLAAWLARVPHRVITVHGFYFHDSMPRWQRRFYIFLEKISSACAHWVFSQSREDINTAIREKICDEGKLHFLGNGVDVNYFRREKHLASASELRAELAIPKDAPVIGIVGRLTFEKGYREFVEAAAVIRQQLPNTHYVAIGPEDVISMADVMNLVNRLNLRPFIHFCGMQVDMPRFYAVMTVFALPSYREGMPRALMEAAAMSVPAVATDIRGCREIVQPGQTGLLVPVGDARRLAGAIMELLGDPERARLMGEEARRKAEREFDESSVFARVGEAYAKLVQVQTIKRDGVTVQRPATKSLYRLCMRVFDVITSIVGLLVLSPLLVLISVGVKVSSRGPVIFTQARAGLRGQPFSLLKFRTMADARDAKGTLLPDDKRLTRLGRLLRSTSMDELPELINVLKGEMSLVGPRPLLLRYLPRYSPEQNRRHEVKPGITGWAQINGRNALSWEQKFALDVWYVDHQSVGLDLKIVLMTLWKMLKREGINQPGQATMEEFRGSTEHRTAG